MSVHAQHWNCYSGAGHHCLTQILSTQACVTGTHNRLGAVGHL